MAAESKVTAKERAALIQCIVDAVVSTGILFKQHEHFPNALLSKTGQTIETQLACKKQLKQAFDVFNKAQLAKSPPGLTIPDENMFTALQDNQGFVISLQNMQNQFAERGIDDRAENNISGSIIGGILARQAVKRPPLPSSGLGAPPLPSTPPPPPPKSRMPGIPTSLTSGLVALSLGSSSSSSKSSVPLSYSGFSSSSAFLSASSSASSSSFYPDQGSLYASSSSAYSVDLPPAFNPSVLPPSAPPAYLDQMQPRYLSLPAGLDQMQPRYPSLPAGYASQPAASYDAYQPQSSPAPFYSSTYPSPVGYSPQPAFPPPDGQSIPARSVYPSPPMSFFAPPVQSPLDPGGPMPPYPQSSALHAVSFLSRHASAPTSSTTPPPPARLALSRSEESVRKTDVKQHSIGYGELYNPKKAFWTAGLSAAVFSSDWSSDSIEKFKTVEKLFPNELQRLKGNKNIWLLNTSMLTYVVLLIRRNEMDTPIAGKLRKKKGGEAQIFVDNNTTRLANGRKILEALLKTEKNLAAIEQARLCAGYASKESNAEVDALNDKLKSLPHESALFTAIRTGQVKTVRDILQQNPHPSTLPLLIEGISVLSFAILYYQYNRTTGAGIFDTVLDYCVRRKSDLDPTIMKEAFMKQAFMFAHTFKLPDVAKIVLDMLGKTQAERDALAYDPEAPPGSNLSPGGY